MLSREMQLRRTELLRWMTKYYGRRNAVLSRELGLKSYELDMLRRQSAETIRAQSAELEALRARVAELEANHDNV